MKEFFKKIIEAIKELSNPTEGDKIQTIMWLLSNGYINSDQAAEMFAKMYSERT